MFNEGDVLGPKIANVKLIASRPMRQAAGDAGTGDELVVIGEDKNGYVNVQGATASGWVKIVLVQKR